MRESSTAPNPLDELLTIASKGLKTLFAPPVASRPTPGDSAAAEAAGRPTLPDESRRLSASLMRVNHAGEIAAQALYHAQSLTARDPKIRAFLRQAAREEGDHLAWCEQRLRELGDRPSLLTPAWYLGSFAIGALAGLLGDRASLGFVAETEDQVEGHLRGHLDRLPAEDRRSRAIVDAMRRDESEHGRAALAAGGVPPPRPVRDLMRATARVMTTTAARL
ncbi:MAG TPA: 2-polyprenyl-3-methyl-6-methoxy-1,4-benzoquinone monooxygenase [Steroidobacteraceae bacterium]|nr:2-polyprenyl-3-methyl-6-methoxy-1,4-benzoquinone monooxygenase [Steroidobacteraceae bacterium]